MLEWWSKGCIYKRMKANTKFSGMFVSLIHACCLHFVKCKHANVPVEYTKNTVKEFCLASFYTMLVTSTYLFTYCDQYVLRKVLEYLYLASFTHHTYSNFLITITIRRDQLEDEKQSGLSIKMSAWVVPLQFPCLVTLPGLALFVPVPSCNVTQLTRAHIWADSHFTVFRHASSEGPCRLPRWWSDLNQGISHPGIF